MGKKEYINFRCFLYAAVIMLTIVLMDTDISYGAPVKNNDRGYSVVRNIGTGADGKMYYNPHYPGQNIPQYQYSVRINNELKTGYCFQPGKMFADNYSYTAKIPANSSAWNDLSDKRKRIVRLIMFYGYNIGKSAPYGNVNDYHAATQALLWEATDGDVTLSEKGIWSDSANKHDDLIRNHEYGEKCYSWIRNQISQHVKGPSFGNKTKAGAVTYKMQYDYNTKKWSRTLTDTRNVNYYERCSDSTTSLKMSRKDNKYTFRSETAGTKVAVMRNSNSSGTNQPLIICKPSNSGMQAIVFGASDETYFYTKFTTQKKGKCTLIKENSDGSSGEGFSFMVENKDNGYKMIHKTDSDGKFVLDVYPGEYILTEILTEEQKDAGFTSLQGTKVTIKENEEKEITVKNTRKQIPFEIVKTSDIGKVEGFDFFIHDLSTGEKNGPFTTDHSGKIYGKLYPGKYVIEEKLTEVQICEGFLEAEPVTISISANQTSTETVKIHNDFRKPGTGINIVKTTSDGSSVQGFKFEIRGNLTPVPLTEALVIRKAQLKTTDYEWKVNAEDLNTINDAARNGHTGTFAIRIEGNSISDALEKNIEFTIEAELKKAGEKTDSEKVLKEYKGVSYSDISVAASSGELIIKRVTDEAGRAETGPLPKGKFTITEKMTVDQKNKYQETTPKEVVISEDDECTVVNFENIAKDTPVIIRKTSEDGRIEGIGFIVTGLTKWDNKEISYTKYTDKNGEINLNLPPGTYTATEKKENDSIYLPVEEKTFEITGEEKEAVIISFENILYKLIMNKTEILEDGEKTENPVSEAIYSVSRMYRINGEEIGISCGEFTTNEKGEFIVTGICPGIYRFTEINTPAGYEIQNEPIEVEVQVNTEKTYVQDTNKRKYGNLDIEKTDENGKPIGGTVFGLYRNLSCTELVREGTTDNTGRLTFDMLNWGTYYIKELQETRGYIKDTEIKEVIIGKNGGTDIKYSIINRQKRGSVKLVKTDDTGKYALEGAVFDLYMSDGTLLLKELVTNSKGEITVSDLQWGSYYFKETKAPEGYSADSSYIRFSVNATTAGVEQTVKAVNKPELSKIVLTKRIDLDTLHYDHGTPSFLFKLTGKDRNGEKVSRTGVVTFSRNMINSSDTESGYVEAEVTFEGLVAGKYKCEEMEVLRYEPGEIVNVTDNGTIGEMNDYVEFDLGANDTASAEFVNKKTREDNYSDTAMIANILKKDRYLTAISAEYVGPDKFEGNTSFDPLDNLEVTAFYDDGTEKGLAYGEYEILGDDGTPFIITPKTAGTYTVTIRYEENGIVKNASFEIEVMAASKIAVDFIENGGTEIDKLYVWKNDALGDYDKALSATERMGYYFEGWYLDKELTEKFSYETAITYDMTLYAKWTHKHLNELSWYEIKSISESGAAQNVLNECFATVKEDLAEDGVISSENYKHTKSFLYNENIYHAYIAGFSHDSKADGSKAGITFLVYEKVGTERMHNNLSRTDAHWADSDLRNIFLAGTYKSFPEDLKNTITAVKKTTSVNSGGSIRSGVVSLDSLWVPSVYELFGQYGYEPDTLSETSASRSKDYGHLNSVGPEGQQYEIFAGNVPDGELNSEKMLSKGYCYWTRSADGTRSNGSFCVINPDGSTGSQ